MKYSDLLITPCLVLFIISATVCSGQQGQGVNSITVDSFNSSPASLFTNLHNPQYVSEGYGIYFANARLVLSRINIKESDNALQIEYNIPEYYDWGNWSSVRCELDPVLNLSDYQRLKLNIKVLEPSNAILRISICDVANINQRGNDELWWFDFKSNVLSNKSDKWQTLILPFKDFYESYGAGTRHNDSRLDLTKIVAYEINIISKAETHPKGKFLLDLLITYK